MVYNKAIKGKNITLRAIKPEDCTDDYVRWLNDPVVNQYLETRWEKQSIESILDYVNSINDSNHSYLFAIVENSSDKHIGNIKIGPVHNRYKYTDISYFIGEPSAWGKGYASEAIGLVTQFGFDVLSLNKIQASVISGNDSSVKALLKNGFSKEAELRDMFLINGEYRNALIYSLLSSERGH